MPLETYFYKPVESFEEINEALREIEQTAAGSVPLGASINVNDFRILGTSPNDTVAFQAALDTAELLPHGATVFAPNGIYTISASLLIPEKCGLRGESITGTRIEAKASTAFSSAMIENKTKTGVGQEFCFVEKLTLDGNRGNGATCEGIRFQQVFINSFIRDVVVNECSSHNIRLLATPDEIANGSGGPVELQNIFSSNCGGSALRVEGDFIVNLIDGAYENVDASQDVIHIDGSLYSGTRAIVNLWSPHLEFSLATIRGVYAKKCVLHIIDITSIGSQLASQHNIFIDTNVDYIIEGGVQSIGTRLGILDNTTGFEYTETFIGKVTNKKQADRQSHESIGSPVGVDVTMNANFNNSLSLSHGSTTSIGDIINAPKGLILLRFSNNNVTIRHNANILLGGLVDFVSATNDILALMNINDNFYEVGRSISAAKQTYNVTNVTSDRTYDADVTTIDELADILGTLISDLRIRGIIL